MDQKQKKNKFWIIFIFYFIIFWILPSFIFGSGLFIKDIGWYGWYMVTVFFILSILFLLFMFKTYGFTKKRLIFLLGALILSYIISALYAYIRVALMFANAKGFPF